MPFLVECAIPYQNLLAAFGQTYTYFPVDCVARFKVLARFDPKLVQRLEPPVPSGRFDTWHLRLPLQEDILLTLVHGLDKRNNSVAKQELFMSQVASTIAYFENKIGHKRSVVLGDFNANPFEPPMARECGERI